MEEKTEMERIDEEVERNRSITLEQIKRLEELFKSGEDDCDSFGFYSQQVAQNGIRDFDWLNVIIRYILRRLNELCNDSFEGDREIYNYIDKLIPKPKEPVGETSVPLDEKLVNVGENSVNVSETPTEISKEERDKKILELHEANPNLGCRKIGEQLGISKSTVHNVLSKIKASLLQEVPQEPVQESS